MKTFHIYMEISPIQFKLELNTKLAFGLKGGLTHYSLDELLLNDPSIVNDPFFNDVSNRWSPNVGVGVILAYQ